MRFLAYASVFRPKIVVSNLFDLRVLLKHSESADWQDLCVFQLFADDVA
jgi:hypothetical protein